MSFRKAIGQAIDMARAMTAAAPTEQPQWQAPRLSLAQSEYVAEASRESTAYRLDVRPVGTQFHGNTVTWWHWTVTEVQTGRVMDHGKARREAKAYAQGNQALHTWSQNLSH